MLTNCKCITEIFDREINMKKNREIIFSYKINGADFNIEISPIYFQENYGGRKFSLQSAFAQSVH